MSEGKPELFTKSSKIVTKNHSVRTKRNPRLQRHDSIGAIEELVQCGICLEKMVHPKMLPCQHTFCLSCLQSHYVTNQTLIKDRSNVIKCPVCQKGLDLEDGKNSLSDLPKNLYIESVLKLLEGNVSPVVQKNDSRCAKCHTFSQAEGQCCQHCMQVFCKVCWTAHLSDLETNLSILVRQVDESKTRLTHKLENLEGRCEQLVESIKVATQEKIELIQMDEEKVLSDVRGVVREGRVTYDNINAQIEELKKKLSSNSFENNPGKVFSFMQLHRETSNLLSQVNHYGEARVIFDSDSFRLDQDTEGIYSEVVDGDTHVERSEVANHLYKTRSFIPKLVWNKCPRPANVAVPPWDLHLLYIAATDTHTVLILNTERRKLEGRLTSPEMVYPQGIAFSNTLQEVYVSDKWKHCIHVFTKSGDYQRCLLSKGNGPGQVRSPHGIAIGPSGDLIICDSGNDRVIIVDPSTGDHISTIGIVNNKTMLNMPTGLAVSSDKIVVADTGNHRIKVFGLDGRKLQEFGSLGRGPGQLRSAEVVAVDPAGFILVGDGGNARVQVFRPDGTVVKIFGGVGSDGFGWVSGICVTNELEIITADSKRRCLRIF